MFIRYQLIWNQWVVKASNLSVYQKGVHFTGIKVFNRLPVAIKQLSHDLKQFKRALKGFLYLHSFYSLDEYLKHGMN
jgi:hypothetical protein